MVNVFEPLTNEQLERLEKDLINRLPDFDYWETPLVVEIRRLIKQAKMFNVNRS